MTDTEHADGFDFEGGGDTYFNLSEDIRRRAAGMRRAEGVRFGGGGGGTSYSSSRNDDGTVSGGITSSKALTDQPVTFAASGTWTKPPEPEPPTLVTVGAPASDGPIIGYAYSADGQEHEIRAGRSVRDWVGVELNGPAGGGGSGRSEAEIEASKAEGRATCPGCGGTGDDDMDESMYCPMCGGEKTVPAAEARAVTDQWQRYGRPSNPFAGMQP